jgi:hypothetical protein
LRQDERQSEQWREYGPGNLHSIHHLIRRSFQP